MIAQKEAEKVIIWKVKKALLDRSKKKKKKRPTIAIIQQAKKGFRRQAKKGIILLAQGQIYFANQEKSLIGRLSDALLAIEAWPN